MKNSGIILLIAVWGWVMPAMADDGWAVSASEWAQPRSGEMVVGLPGVRAAMSALLESSTARLAIHHPGGDQGIWWAEELKGWLVTLGVSSNRIELVPGSGGTDMMYLTLIES
jgi:hypothetical protein